MAHSGRAECLYWRFGAESSSRGSWWEAAESNFSRAPGRNALRRSALLTQARPHADLASIPSAPRCMRGGEDAPSQCGTARCVTMEHPNTFDGKAGRGL